MSLDPDVVTMVYDPWEFAWHYQDDREDRYTDDHTLDESYERLIAAAMRISAKLELAARGIEDPSLIPLFTVDARRVLDAVADGIEAEIPQLVYDIPLGWTVGDLGAMYEHLNSWLAEDHREITFTRLAIEEQLREQIDEVLARGREGTK